MVDEKKVVSQGKMSCQQISKIIMEEMSKIKVPVLEHILMQLGPLSSIRKGALMSIGDGRSLYCIHSITNGQI